MEDFVKDCPKFDESDRNKTIADAPLTPVPLPRKAWDKIAIDLKGPIKGGRYKYLLVIVDYFSKWPEIIGMTSITSSSVIAALRRVFARYGIPKGIVSDNGTQFVSRDTEAFLEELNIVHTRVALYAPHQNGLVERFNRFLSEKIQEAEKFNWNIDRTLEAAVFHYRSTPHATTRVSPFEAMFGRKMPNRLSQLYPENGIAERKAIDPAQVRTKKDFDRSKSVKSRSVKIGDSVRIKGLDGVFGSEAKVTGIGTSSMTITEKRGIKKHPWIRCVLYQRGKQRETF